jgi:uncharacterized protein YbjT (DUF2867 family)
MPRLIAVTGATGNQGLLFHPNKLIALGGSVAKYLLQFPELYSVRALTRNPENPAAIALKDRGAEVVKADLTKPEDLKPALEGCWGVFGVTNFYDSVSSPAVRLT